MGFSKRLKASLAGGALLTSAAFAVTALTGLVATSATAQSGATKPSETLVLSIGRGQLVNLPSSMADLFIADDGIADVQVKSSKQLYVFGKAGGETTLYASNAAGQVIYSATVRVGSNIDSIDQMMTLAMPDAKIRINTMNGIVLLTGQVASPDDSAEAVRLVEALVGTDTKVISRLTTATPMQVNLQVRFAEVSRSLVKEIGANLLTRDQSGGFLFGVGRTGRDFASISSAPGLNAGQIASLPRLDPSSTLGLPAGTIGLTPFNPATGQFVYQAGGQTIYDFKIPTDGTTAVQAAGKLFGLDVAAAFDLAEEIGLVTTLSQPNLTTLSGETADFLAGGEFPIPISQGLGQTTIEYRNFGVSLAYTPTVLANGRISMRVRPEVSELSSAGAVTLNGFQVPALTIRRAETTVELGSGQSFMIAGLMSNNSQNTIEKAPGLGDVPVLGNLFKSTSYRKGETELVIVVTPYLVKPMNANDVVLPTDAYQNSNDAQRLLFNQESDGITGGDRPKPRVDEPANNGPDVGIAPVQPRDRPSRQAKVEKKPSSGGNALADASVTPGFSFE